MIPVHGDRLGSRLLHEVPRPARTIARAARILVCVLGLASLLPTAHGNAVASAQPPAASAGGRVVAVGDVHGDYDAFVEILSAAGLVDSRGRWSGHKATLVQMGDAVDRGPRSREVIELLQRLQREASRAGGKVIALIGNHEAMNMTGDLRYVPATEYRNYVTRDSRALRERVFESHQREIAAALRQNDPGISDADVKAKFFEESPLGYIEQRRAWSTDGEIGRWVLANPVVAIVGETLFVHGGISEKYSVESVAQLNDLVHAALRTRSTANDALLEDEVGPLWYRGLASESDVAAREVEEILKAFRVKRIVIAHTPNLAGIKVLEQGRVILIDTGISAAYGGVHSFLSIEGESVFAHDGARVTELESSEFRR